MFRSSMLLGIAALALGSSAFAGAPQAGSLLVYPIFSNARFGQTFVTVTNNSSDSVNGTVRVEFVYINGLNCQETNRTRTLTPNDTLTVVTSWDNPNAQRGYLYVFAKDAQGRAIAFDHLIGVERYFGATSSEDYDVKPFVFKAGAGLAEGALTDLDHDGIRDLNGAEYEQAPAEIQVPRFIGQGFLNAPPPPGPRVPVYDDSSLILINLTGGAAFQAIVDFLIYNDNEEVFSAQYQFTCWRQVNLLDISNVFSDSFLASTNNAPGENLAMRETGWFRINGNIAFSSAAQFQDPAILAVLVERLEGGVGADLPFTEGTQANGDLLPRGIFGDLTP